MTVPTYVTESSLSVTYIAELASLNEYPIGDGPVSPTDQFKQSFDSFYATDSPLSVTNIGNVLVKLTSFNDYPLGNGPVSPTGRFK